MADTTALKNRIRAAIKANDNQEITGPVLQQALLDMVDELNGATETEAGARQSGDSTLQQAINSEAQTRQSGDTALDQRITEESRQRQDADTALQNLINGITDNIENGYVYAGIATPSSTPATGKVFYLALTAGTYTNFGSTEVSHGINILKYNGSAWSLDAFIGIDDEVIAGSKKIPSSQAVINKFFDFALLSGYGENAKHCLSNFRYFICKKPELIAKEPRFTVIYNDSAHPYSITIAYNDGTEWGMANAIGHIEDDNYAFYYDWDKHNQSLNVNNYYSQSKITVVASSYAQAFSNLLKQFKSSQTAINNSQKFYDIVAETYSSDKVRERSAVILEMYVDGEPFESDNPLEFARRYSDQVSFIRKNEQLWAFYFSKPLGFTGITLETVQYSGRTIYAVVNWGAPLTNEVVHSNIIISDGCYSLDNNPAISAYLKNNNLISNLQKIDYTKLYTIDEMNSMFHHGKYLENGRIKVVEPAEEKPFGVIFVPIEAGQVLKTCIAQVHTASVFSIIGFCTSTEINQHYTEIVGDQETSDPIYNIENDYTATTNGYIAIWCSDGIEQNRIFKGIKTFEDVKPLECNNQLPVMEIISNTSAGSDECIVQNNQDTLNEAFTGKVSEIELVHPFSGNDYYIVSNPFAANDKLREYANEDDMFIYPIKIGCRVFNNNNHTVTFKFGLRYRYDSSWRLPAISKSIAANSYEDFELVLYLDLRTTTVTDLDLYSNFSTGSQVGDTFTIGNTYYKWYDIKHRDVACLDPSQILPGIKESQLAAELQAKIDNNQPKYPSLPKKIICSGSSITWGNGKFDDSMVLYLDKFVKEKLSTTILPAQMTFPQGYTTVNQAMMYNNSGRKISNIGDTIEFDSYGDEIAICQMKRRTKTDFGIVNVYADDVLIGRFDNKNFIGSETEIFSGSNIREIRLKHPCTFNHAITINGSTVLSRIIYNKGGYGGTVPSDPSTFDAFVFRALDENGHPVHRIQFSTALGTITSVNISYDYGNIVAHERSTLGQTADEYENESYYGSGNVSYDPAHPTSGISSGMEFRGINKESFFVHKFTSTKMRHFKLELIDGNNPYFIINFATNRYNDMMNAGIGGWTIAHLINMDKWCDYTEFFKWFKPEIIFQESETNDDWSYSTRRIRRNIGEITLAQLQKLHWLEVYAVTYNSSTGKYDVDMCTGIISSITYTSLISQDIVGTQTQVGDIIRIGNYHGDIKQITCRRITEVNLETGEVKWVEPISTDDMLNVDSLQDLVGAEINIRDLSGYKTAYKTYIEKVHEIAPEATVVVVDNGLPMLGARQLWGYDIIHREIVAESNNAVYCDARDVLYKGQFDNITGTRKETVTPDGSDSYNLSFTGACKSWCGFKVLVNGIDVYGRDCYIECQYAYRAKSSLSGTLLNKTSPYDRSQASDSTEGLAMKLVFTKNIPTVNDTVEVWYSNDIWSSDYCHPQGFGSFLYGQAYSKFIE